MIRLKMILIITAIFLNCFKSSAQNFKGRGLLGLNAAQVDGDSYGGYNQPGIFAGVSVYKVVNKKYDIGFEMALSQKGSHKKTTVDDPDIFKLRYTYICLPVFVDFNTIFKSLPNFYARLGVSNNLKITSKVNFGYGWIDNSIKPWELSGVAGIGYRFNKHLGFMIRHENSLLSIGVPGNNPTFYKVNRRGLYNRMVGFVLQYDL